MADDGGASGFGQPATRAVWTVGEAYEPYVGRWSRAIARQFVPLLDLGRGGRWLDVGCGTGALAAAALDSDAAAPAVLVSADPSPGFVAYAREHLPHPRARWVVADARRLPFADGVVDVVTSGLVLNFVPDPLGAVREMARVTRPGGRVAAYVWDYAGRMQLIRWFWDAAVALDPSAAGLDEARGFGLCQPGPLERLLRDAGLGAVQVHPIDVPTVFQNFDDYWLPFLGGQGPAPGYVAALDDAGRTALREWLRARLPTAPDGSIPLVARAWAVRGTAPGETGRP